MKIRILIIALVFFVNTPHESNGGVSFPPPTCIDLTGEEIKSYSDNSLARKELTGLIEKDFKNKYSEIGGFVYLVKESGETYFRFIDIESYNSLLAKKALVCGDNQGCQEKLMEDHIHGFRHICGSA